MRDPKTLLAILLAFAAACSKPDPPVLTPKSAKVTAVTLAGVDITVDVEAYNPNGVELSARGVTGKVVLDGRYDLGTTTVSKIISLPAGARTDLEVPLAVTWKDAAALVPLATSNRTIPFTIDGTVTVGGARLNVDLPFHLAGSMTHDELVQATTRSLPAIPGFKLPL
jgi:LEA14-like dessication related protein